MERVIELHSENINNNILKLIDRTIKQYGGSYRIIKINFEDPDQDKVYIKLAVEAEGDKFEQIRRILTKTKDKAVQTHETTILKPSLKDATAPPDFYSTSNHPTEVFIRGEWLQVKNIRMDALLVLRDGEIYATQLRDIKQGDLIVCTSAGVRVKPGEQNEGSGEFAFMTNEVSSERHVELEVRELAKKMKTIIGRGGKVYVVAGPVVIHTGGMIHFQDIIRKGYVSGLLSGNALAVHDIEFDLLGTSLGIDLNTGNAVPGGHSHHLRAINAVNIAGSIAAAVADGTISSGIMYELVKNDVPFVLAGSIRDDGPLPDTIMDLIRAQEAYTAMIRDADLVIMLSTMLHSIGTGNMLPSYVETVCVDINPAVVNKLVDRGSAQAKGIVTDVGLFLSLLNQNL